MTDDIVTRLREQCCCTENTRCSDACLAADEIERLRKERDRAQARAQYWARMYDELTEIANTKLDDDEPDDD